LTCTAEPHFASLGLQIAEEVGVHDFIYLVAALGFIDLDLQFFDLPA
jgi:hypothetical protein